MRKRQRDRFVATFLMSLLLPGGAAVAADQAVILPAFTAAPQSPPLAQLWAPVVPGAQDDADWVAGQWLWYAGGGYEWVPGYWCYASSGGDAYGVQFLADCSYFEPVDLTFGNGSIWLAPRRVGQPLARDERYGRRNLRLIALASKTQAVQPIAPVGTATPDRHRVQVNQPVGVQPIVTVRPTTPPAPTAKQLAAATKTKKHTNHKVRAILAKANTAVIASGKTLASAATTTAKFTANVAVHAAVGGSAGSATETAHGEHVSIHESKAERSVVEAKQPAHGKKE